MQDYPPIEYSVAQKQDQALIRKCIKGLARYAVLCAKGGEIPSMIDDVRGVVKSLAFYWNLDDFCDEIIKKEFLQPFDFITSRPHC